ncbi:tol-pal system YbgF family protein [Aquimarina sp. SS2-1]|uniref:tetratricopeptide repeat protein n=1 Tax=Aquimarina besae TaxID=3342247 RepID=UPI00366E4D26
MSIEEDMLIQNFLKDTLSKKERSEVLLKMENDNDFREKVNFEKQLLLNLNESEWSISTNHELQEVKEYEALLKSESTKVLTDTISAVNHEYQLKQNRGSQSWLLYTGIAVILVLIGFTIFSPFKATPEELYVSYLDVSELPSLVDRGSSEQKSLIEAQKLFETKEYDEVLDILINGIDGNTKNRAIVYLYTGISQMELNQFDSAEKTFDELINSNLIDAPKGTWYKCLLYLKQNKTEKAKKLLSEMVKYPNGYKHKEALELLDKL